MHNQPSLENLRQRVAQAEAAVPVAIEGLQAARKAAAQAALALRDLEYCHNAGILSGDDPELVEAIAQAQQTRRRLSEARVNHAYAQRALTYASDYLVREEAETLDDMDGRGESPPPSARADSL